VQELLVWNGFMILSLLHHQSTGVDPEGVLGVVAPLLSTTEIFFQQPCELEEKNRLEYSMDAIDLYLRSQNNSAGCQTSTCLA
jgi:hypothetical protein